MTPITSLPGGDRDAEPGLGRVRLLGEDRPRAISSARVPRRSDRFDPMTIEVRPGPIRLGSMWSRLPLSNQYGKLMSSVARS